MQTFLIIVGILFVCGVLAVLLGIAWLKKMAAKGAVWGLKQGIVLLNEQAKADYVTAELRAQLSELNTKVDALPEPSLFTGKSVLLQAIPLAEEMANLGRAINDLRAADEQDSAGAITVEASEVVPAADAEVRALPAPAAATSERPAGKSDEAILADFTAEFITPGDKGVKDAWLVGAGDDVFIKYQLKMEVADQAMETGKLTDVPMVYQGIPTIITWWDRESEA